MRSSLSRPGVALWLRTLVVLALAGCSPPPTQPVDAALPPGAVSLEIDPPFATVRHGCPAAPVRLRAMLTEASGARRALQTGEVFWTSADPAVVAVDDEGVLHAGDRSEGTTITALFRGRPALSQDVAVTNALAECVTALTVIPATPVLPAHATLRLEVQGRYNTGRVTDGSAEQVAWSSSDAAVLAVDRAGIARALRAGEATVTARVGDVASDVRVTVTSDRLVALHVEPPATTVYTGASAIFRAVGVFASGYRSDVTSVATWTSSDPVGAGVYEGDGGMVVRPALAGGAATVTASLDGMASNPARISVVTAAQIASLAITPGALDLGFGTTARAAATATLDDGRSVDVTSSVAWGSPDPQVVRVDGSGNRLVGVGLGRTVLRAVLGALQAQADVQVTERVLLEVEITPARAVVAPGTPLAFDATGRFSDGTARALVAGVAWSASETPTLGLSAAGEAVARAPGTTEVRATVDAMVGATVVATVGATSVTVTDAAPSALSVLPAPRSLPTGAVVRMTVLATFADGTTQDVTTEVGWVPAPASLGVVTSAGWLHAAREPGVGTLTAHFRGVAREVPLVVADDALVRLEVTPGALPALQAAERRRFTATGYYRALPPRDLTLDPGLTWRTTEPAVLAFGGVGAGPGVVTALAPGDAAVSASFHDGQHAAVVSNAVAVRVAPREVLEVRLAPESDAVPVGFSTVFHAAVVSPDGSTQDADARADLTWQSDDPLVARASNAAATRGVVLGARTGATRIAVALDNVGGWRAAATLTVTAARLRSLAISPATLALAADGPGVPLVVTGTFDDGTTRDVTRDVALTSGDPTRVRILGAVAAAVTAATPATGVALTARYGDVTATATASVGGR